MARRRMHFAVPVQVATRTCLLHEKKPACKSGLRPSRAACSFVVSKVNCSACKDTEAFEEASGRVLLWLDCERCSDRWPAVSMVNGLCRSCESAGVPC